VVLREIRSVSFSADFNAVSAANHFALFFFETGTFPTVFFSARQKTFLRDHNSCKQVLERMPIF
jgi:hypothetical protein